MRSPGAALMGSSFQPDKPEFYLSDPDTTFRRLRAEDPLPWYEEGGFWCVTRHADVQAVSVDPKRFCSGDGTQIFEIANPRDAIGAVGEMAPSIIQMDPPQHNLHRKLVIKGFTPLVMKRLEGRIREIAIESLGRVPRGETVDFVESVAIPLPMWVIAELLGVPAGDQASFRKWSDAMIVAGGGGFGEETVATIGELFAYFSEELWSRRKDPRDDILSTLLAAEIEGTKLNEQEILMFCMTLLVAGNETTRNLISGGALTLLDHPDQHDLLVAEPQRIPNAVEEMLRWVTPVRTFARRATRDTELRGKPVAKGDFLVLLYGSANRDEEVFGETAHLFDVTRENASRHLAFGHGEHLCMGASLARLEARVLFEELFARLPHFELAGPAVPLSSVLMNGIVEMPVVFEP
jgi:cytochrome P450